MTRFLAAAFACLLFVAPAVASETCKTWEDGVRTAAQYSHDADDRVAAVLLTPDETKTTWLILFKGKDGYPHRLGVMVSQSDPEGAFVAGFDEAGCLVGTGTLPFGPVLDAMVSAKVKSEFVIIEPRAKDVGV